MSTLLFACFSDLQMPTTGKKYSKQRDSVKTFTSGNRKIDEFRYQRRPFRKTAAKRTPMENVEKERNSNERRDRMGGSLQTGLR